MRTLVLAIALLLPHDSSAQEVVVLDADFNADTPGEPPDTSLPGDPEGDSISLSGVSANGTFLVEATAATLIDKPLVATRTGNTVGFACAFNLPEYAYGCGNLIVRWCSVAVSAIPPSFFQVLGPGGQSDFFGLLNFRTDNSITISPMIGVPEEVTIGSWTQGESQCFEWHLDKKTGLQSLFIDGVAAVEDFQTFWEPSSGDAILFKYSMALQDPFTYAMDDVEISVVDCETPVEERSWGSVKSTYR